MAVSDARDVDDVGSDGSAGLETPVYACRTSPDRTVFTEEGNWDGWIATDLTVEPRR